MISQQGDEIAVWCIAYFPSSFHATSSLLSRQSHSSPHKPTPLRTHEEHSCSFLLTSRSPSVLTPTTLRSSPDSAAVYSSSKQSRCSFCPRPDHWRRLGENHACQQRAWIRRPECSQLVSRWKCACKKGVASRGKAGAGDAKDPTKDGMWMVWIQQKTVCGYYGSGQKNDTTSGMRIMRRKNSLLIASLDQWTKESSAQRRSSALVPEALHVFAAAAT
jgi:hypothetical protein